MKTPSLALLTLFLAFCGLADTARAQIPYAMITPPQACFIDLNGNPASGGFLYSYAAGTSTQQATYHLDTLGNLTPNTNPVILGANGCAEVRLTPVYYKFVLQQNSSGCTPPACPQIWSVDQVADIGQIVYTQSVLLNPPGGATQNIAGALSFTNLILNSGAALTTSNQSGVGSLCMTTNCALNTPSVNGITIPGDPATLISIPNLGTAVNTLTKLVTGNASWSKRNDQSGTGTGSPQTATSFSTSLTNPSLIVVLTSGPVGTFSVTDTAGNTYVDCGQGQLVFNSSANGVQCFYAMNTHTTASNVVSFASTGGGVMNLTATEWTGVALVSPVDVTQNSGPNQNTGSGGGQNVSSGATTTSGADLVIGITAVAAGTLTAGTGFNASTSAALEYQIQSGPAATAATWSDNTNSDPYAAMLVAFRPFAGTTSFALQAATNDTSGIVGITVSGAGASGNAIIQQNGSTACVFDGPTNANDYIQISTSVPGYCHDTGATTFPTTGGQVIGTVISTNGTAGTYQIVLAGVSSLSGGGTGTIRTVCSTATPVTVHANTTSKQAMTACQLNSGSLNVPGKTFRVTLAMSVDPLGTATSAVTVGIGATAGLSNFLTLPVSSQPSAATQWFTSATVTCVVQTSGTSGVLSCSLSPYVTGGSGIGATGPYTLISGVNLVGPTFVGDACYFGSASASNSCTQTLITVEQLN